MFLAHFSSTPLLSVLEMDATEAGEWISEAIELYNYLNRQK